MNLFISYFNHSNQERKEELNLAITKNLSNSLIKQVVIFDETKTKWPSGKVKVINVDKRPTYQDFINEMSSYPEDINILSNTDIAFNSTLSKAEGLRPGYCYAITRHELIDDEIKCFEEINHGCPAGFSQDVWIFKGDPKLKGFETVIAKNSLNNRYDTIRFTPGIAGCDNVFAAMLKNKGVRVINPYKDIECLHIHRETKRPHYSHRITGGSSTWGIIFQGRTNPSKI